MKIIRRRMKALYCYEDFYIGYFAGKLFKCYFDRKKVIYICRLPISGCKYIFTKFRVLERATHINPRAVFALDDDNILIAIDGKIFRINHKDRYVVNEFSFPKGMNSPLNFFKLSGISGFEDCIIFGEYLNVCSPHEICIYKRSLEINAKWIKVFKFERGCVQHIHGFICNQNNDGIIVMTGDNDHESGFWEIKNYFIECNPILLGSQRFRACVGCFIDGELYYATDNPYGTNYLSKYDVNTGRCINVCELNGTVINGLKINDKLLFSTAVESKPYKKNWQKFFPRKRAEGIVDNTVSIYVLDKYGRCEEIIKFIKDKWYMPLFGFGTVEFCQTETKRILCNPIAVKKWDNCVLELTLHDM